MPSVSEGFVTALPLGATEPPAPLSATSQPSPPAMWYLCVFGGAGLRAPPLVPTAAHVGHTAALKSRLGGYGERELKPTAGNLHPPEPPWHGPGSGEGFPSSWGPQLCFRVAWDAPPTHTFSSDWLPGSSFESGLRCICSQAQRGRHPWSLSRLQKSSLSPPGQMSADGSAPPHPAIPPLWPVYAASVSHGASEPLS